MAHAVHRSRIQEQRSPSIVGWHGIYLEVPENWNLAAVSGEMNQGHLRVDGPADMHIRIKWQRVRGKPNTEPILDRYLKQVRRQSRKAGEEFESSADVRLNVHSDNSNRKPRFFSWRGSSHAIGMIWHCPACGRVTIAQVDGPLKKNLALIATQVMGSLDDHAVDGCHTWAVYGLAAEVPADFDLVKNKLLSGYIQLHFTRGKTTVMLERWALAEVALRKGSLEDWVKSRCHSTLKNYTVRSEPAEVREHVGVLITGSISNLRDRVTARAKEALSLNPVSQLTQYAWHCEQTNRICSVQVQHTRKERDLAEEIAASYLCHT